MPRLGLGRRGGSLSLHDVGTMFEGWNPRNIPGLTLWLRADLGITLNGSTVSGWADQSGNGENYTQSTAANQPAQGTLGGKPALVFNGSTWMQAAAAFAVGAKTIAVVFQVTTQVGNPGNCSLIGAKNTDNSFSEYLWFINTNTSLHTYIADGVQAAGSSVGMLFNGTADLNPHAGIFAYNGGTDTTTSNYLGNLDDAPTTIAGSTSIGRTTTDLNTIGARVTSGLTVSAGLIGTIAEIVATKTSLTAGQLATLAHYFKGRYGV